MTDVGLRLTDMDRARIDVAVLSLSTPNVFFVAGKRQASIARLVNDAYAQLVREQPRRFRAFASVPMDRARTTRSPSSTARSGSSASTASSCSATSVAER